MRVSVRPFSGMFQMYTLAFSHPVTKQYTFSKTCPCHIQRFFFSEEKNENFIGKILIFFYTAAQSIHCGYMLETPREV